MNNYINRNDLYQNDKPNLKERTKNRLIKISELGMSEVGIAEFGITGIMSGLYIEKIWSYSDEEWDRYINWVKELILLSQKKIHTDRLEIKTHTYVKR